MGNRRSLTLDDQFKPVDAEKTQEFYNLAVGKQHTVLMNFRAHPRPTKLHWELYDGTTVNEGSESLDQRFYAEQLAEGPTDGYYTAKLDIKNVKAEDAGTTSNLVVTNELGTTNYQFSLHGGEKPASEAGSGPVIAIVIVAIIIIVVIVVAVIARSQGLLCFADPPHTEEDKEKAVEKAEGSDTESAKQAEGAQDEKDAAVGDESGGAGGANNNNSSKKSVTARMNSLLMVMKKTVGSKKEKIVESESEVKLQENEEKKENKDEDLEKKNDSIVYADLDKSVCLKVLDRVLQL